MHYIFLPFGIFLASANLLLSFYFREVVSGLSQPTMETASWLFIAEPIYNWGGFFVDGNEPSIHRLPTTLFLVWASVMLIKYLTVYRSNAQGIFAAVFLGGVGGLILDILAYGSVCDWLGFSLPGSIIYSMLNISDLMILISAPFAAIVCVDRWYLQLLGFLFAIAVIGANTYHHVEHLKFG